jgi:ATP:ADP antiporter, AAA family
LAGVGVATLAAMVARRAGWSPDLAPDDQMRIDGGKTPPV